MTLFAWRRWWGRDGLPALRLLALEKWDPLGVHGVAEAVDAYDAYLDRVGRMLKRGAGADEVAQYLAQVRAKAMERGDAEPTMGEELFAEEVVAWYSLESPPRR